MSDRGKVGDEGCPNCGSNLKFDEDGAYCSNCGSSSSEQQPGLDLTARYAVDGYPGIAFYLRGYVRTPLVDDETGEELRVWMGELDDAYDIDRSQVRAVMVGDDREHLVDVDDLTPLDELGYCAVCGQIGCEHDGRDRE